MPVKQADLCKACSHRFNERNCW